MKKEVFTKSENFKQEYSATIVKVGELKDIENSDNLKQAIIDGFSVVVNKNDVKEGDIMVYCKNETELNGKFLSKNNMYEIGERELNSNYGEVERLMEEGNADEAKKLVGYFNKHGRVKMIRLRGCPSMGVLLRFESFLNYFGNKLANVNLEDYVSYDENGNFVPFDFDTVCGELFIKAYVPKIRGNQHHTGTGSRKRKERKFNRMIEGEWKFHYDTNQLNSNMWRFNPEQVVTISNKLHGTSLCLGNILTKNPIHVDAAMKWWNKNIDKKIKGVRKTKTKQYNNERRKQIERLAAKKIKEYTIGYNNIYSSRTVIKNQFINRSVTSGYYKVDVWGVYNELFKGIIPKGMMIYGEIVGYLTDSQSMIQKGYDYGCPIGENKFMIYRITQKTDGKTIEYNPMDVVKITKKLISENPKLQGKVIELPILYHGKFGDLYKDVDTSEHWNENVLERMKCDKDNFGMELDEPMCKNKVPREGVVIRIDDDEVAEAFKLKTVKFLMKEQKDIDAGNVDVEMMDNYVSNN